MGRPPAIRRVADRLDPAWILHAADDLLVLDKPPGLLCQPGLGPELADSLISRVQQRWPEARLVHRLDRDTSGLILVALSAELHRGLSGLFAQRQVEKRYLADVQGRPVAGEGRIDLAIARRQRQPPLYGPDPTGKPCRTLWRRLELQPLTGRSHQLRVHLSAIGHPILGDPLYAPAAAGARAEQQERPPPPPVGSRRLHLHASGLRFVHPFSGEPLAFQSACPF
jgi:tRNA pseudouridine32 synthase/23S rRNA pseudouridine746 synthase